MTTKQTRARKKFSHTILVERVTDAHLVIDQIEEEALTLGLDEMFEVYLAVDAITEELKKIYSASRDLGFKEEGD